MTPAPAETNHDQTASVSAQEQVVVCKREIAGPMGGATVYMVRLPDGFLLDCGSGFGEGRAHVLAEIINAGDLQQLTDNALCEWGVPF